MREADDGGASSPPWQARHSTRCSRAGSRAPGHVAARGRGARRPAGPDVTFQLRRRRGRRYRRPGGLGPQRAAAAARGRIPARVRTDVGSRGGRYAPRDVRGAQRAGVVLVPQERRVPGAHPRLGRAEPQRHDDRRPCAGVRSSSRPDASAPMRSALWPRLRRPRPLARPGGADALGRQPAEGGAGAVPGARVRACSCSTSRPAAWTWPRRARSTALIRAQAAAGCAVLDRQHRAAGALGLCDRIVGPPRGPDRRRVTGAAR